MTHALLAAEQIVGDLVGGSTSKFDAHVREFERDAQALPPGEFFRCDNVRSPGAEFTKLVVPTTVAAHLRQAKRSLMHLAAAREREQQQRRFSQAMKWLADNRQLYAGRWVALEGDRLLAEGTTSREVFSQIADSVQPPLVVQVEEEELPFAGW